MQRIESLEMQKQSQKKRTRAQDDFERQERALRGEIDIDDAALILFNEDIHGAICALKRLKRLPFFPSLSEEKIDFMDSHFLAKYLIPVADPYSTGATWPTIIVPSHQELSQIMTDEDEQCVLEILRDWRSHVDQYASAIPCTRSGWIGGVWVPHPSGNNEFVVRWPWRHRPYGKAGRRGDPRLFELFGVSVNARPY
jgi:hypothetical protein